MVSKTEVIANIREKIGRLMDENRRLRGELSAVAEVQEKAKKENRELREEIAKLEKKLGKAELMAGMQGVATSSGGDKKSSSSSNKPSHKRGRQVHSVIKEERWMKNWL